MERFHGWPGFWLLATLGCAQPRDAPLDAAVVPVIDAGADSKPPLQPPPDAPAPPDAPPIVPELILWQDGYDVSTLWFPDTLVGVPISASGMIKNVGSVVAPPLALSLPFATDFTFDPSATTCDGAILLPGASCVVTIVFKPMTEGYVNKYFEVTSGGGTYDWNLAADGQVPHPTLGSTNFGMVVVGRTVTRSISITNYASFPAPLDTLIVEGSELSLVATTCGAMLAPHATCSASVSATPQQLGWVTGALVVTSGGVHYKALIFVDGAWELTVQREGPAAATVSVQQMWTLLKNDSAEPSVTALFDSAQTLTAMPDADAEVAWLYPGCEGSLICTVDPTLPGVIVRLHVSVPEVPLHLVMNGSTGTVAVVSFAGATTCNQSCDVNVPVGREVSIYPLSQAPTAYSAPCTAIAPCTFTMANTEETVTLTFAPGRADLWTYVTPNPVQSVDSDTSGNVIAGTDEELIKLSPDGIVIWRIAVPVDVLATGPDDTIYVVSAGTLLKKIEASGAELWSVPLGTYPTRCIMELLPRGQCIAVGADGAVAVRSDDGVTRWSADGTPTWSRAVSSWDTGIAIDSTGIVHVAIEDPLYPPDDIAAYRIAPDGTVLPERHRVGWAYMNRDFAIDGSNRLFSSATGYGNAYVVYSDLSDPDLDHPHGFASYYSTDADNFPSGIATSPSGKVAWWTMTDDDGIRGRLPQRFRIYGEPGTTPWSMLRRHFSYDLWGDHFLGYVTFDIAMTPTDRLVVGGRYDGYGSANQNMGFIQVFAPQL